MADFRLEKGRYKIVLEYFVIPENKEMFNKLTGYVINIKGPFRRGSHWANMEQFEH